MHTPSPAGRALKAGRRSFETVDPHALRQSHTARLADVVARSRIVPAEPADNPGGGRLAPGWTRWVDEAQGKSFCLVEAPDAESAAQVHREAHGLVADEIYHVAEGS